MIYDEGAALKLLPGTYPQTPFLYITTQLQIFHEIGIPKGYDSNPSEIPFYRQTEPAALLCAAAFFIAGK